jgi:hypothetical protein
MSIFWMSPAQAVQTYGDATMPIIDLEKGQGTTWLWLALIALLFVALVAWAADPLGWADDAQPDRPAASAIEWTAAPEGPAIPVDLPDVPVKAVPADNRAAG